VDFFGGIEEWFAGSAAQLKIDGHVFRQYSNVYMQIPTTDNKYSRLGGPDKIHTAPKNDNPTAAFACPHQEVLN
jgi:hypothetical protein